MFNIISAAMRFGVVAKFRCHRDWTPIRGAPRLDSGDRRRISRGRRWSEPAARIADLADHFHSHCSRNRSEAAAFCATDAGHAIGALRHVHRPEFRSLVPVLRDEPDPGFSADQNLGRRKSRSRRDEVFPLHISRQRRDVAFVPRDLFREGNVRLRALWRVLERAGCSRETSRGSLLPEFLLALR